MKIGINLLPYNELGGIAIYIQHLLESLGKLDYKNSFFIFIGRNTLPIFKFNYKNFYYIETPIDSYRKVKRVIYEQLFFPFLLRKYKIDLLFNPSVSGPIFWPGKKISTIHDCAYDIFKEFDTFRSKTYFKLMFYGSVKFFSKIITDSDFSKKEIVKFYKVNSNKIEIVYAATPKLPTINDKFAEDTLNKFSIKKPYFFYVGGWRPRKNLPGLIEGFKLFQENNKSDWLLVISGKKDRRFLNLEKNISKNRLEKDVILTGTLSPEEVVALYKKSKALTFPSFYEGFGLPILEAQSLGVPVLTSNISSMPEVAGKGALYVNPYDISDIAKGMEKLAENNDLCHELIQKGFENIKRFSWEESVKKILKIFYEGSSSQ